MPVTALDSKTALVLIDLQNGIVGRPLQPFTSTEVIDKSKSLINAFRKAGQPIVIVNVEPKPRPVPARTDFKMPAMQFPVNFADIVPDIDVMDEDIRITKHTPSAFYNTDLHEELQKRDVTGIVLAGIATSIGVEATARAASERGYNISFASDAMTDMNPNAHENSQTVIFPRLGEVDTTASIIGMLDKS